MLKLTIAKGPRLVGQTYSIDPSKSLLLGRAEECDIKLTSAGVSKRHCRFTAVPGGKLEVEDLNSSNGTFVNGLMIKKHVAKVGDSIGVHEYILQISESVPELKLSTANSGAQMMPFNFNNVSQPSYNPPPARSTMSGVQEAPVEIKNLTFAEKIERWLESNVYPLADSLSAKFDVRFLFFTCFMSLSVLIIFLTAQPFSQKANDRVQGQAVEVAKFYARQLVRINEMAIVEQRYQDLIARLDARAGQTPGLISAWMLDATKGQVLAPPDLLGQSLPNKYAAIAVAQGEEFTQIDSDGIAYVSAPIKVDTNTEKNKVVATAFVMFDTARAQFTIASIFDQAVTSLLLSLVVMVIFFVFVYRWTDGSLLRIADAIDQSLKGGQASVATPVRWPSLAALSEQVSFAMGRSGAGEVIGNSSGGTSPEWANAIVQTNMVAAAAFNSAKIITAWNPRIEKLLSIRSSMAMNQDIGAASPDVSFESAVKQLIDSTNGLDWAPANRPVELSGTAYNLAMTHGSGSFLLTITKAED